MQGASRGLDWTGGGGGGGAGTRGAHSEHFAYVRDAGRVEAQWLVERIHILPSHIHVERIHILPSHIHAHVHAHVHHILPSHMMYTCKDTREG